MKQKLIPIVLAILLSFALIPTASFASVNDVVYTDTRGNKITIPGGAESCATKVISFTHGDPWTNDTKAMNPEDVLGAPDYDSRTDTNYLCLGKGGSITLEFSIEIIDGDGLDIYVFEIGPDVEATKVEVSNDLTNWIYVGDADGSLSGVDLNGKVPAGAAYKYVRITDRDGKGSGWPGADIDAVAGLAVKAQTTTPTTPSGGEHSWSNAHDWATPELEKAQALGLIPDSLKGADLTKPITRAEFAAVSVKVYESLSSVKATPVARNPFTDTSDPEVLKAYNVGITNGITSTTFKPNDLLVREQAATMLTRVIKKINIPGWTLTNDNQYTLNYTKPAAFADDAQISGYAKDSVYFMVANGIINGVGNNRFAPRNTTSAQEAANYAAATREASLLIAVRMVENLKGKDINYS